MRGRAQRQETEMKQLLRDIEPIFQRVVKINPSDVEAHHTLAAVEIFRCMNNCVKTITKTQNLGEIVRELMHICQRPST